VSFDYELTPLVVIRGALWRPDGGLIVYLMLLTAQPVLIVLLPTVQCLCSISSIGL